MFELRCTVRNCLQSLYPKDGGLSCSAGHHFDRAKEGYWSLLQPQDRKSKNPGDSDEAVLARQRWLERGHTEGLVETLRPWLKVREAADNSLAPRVLDLGCGEGSFGPALYSGGAGSYCGIDLSKRAIKLASRQWPEATWVWANADRTLPVADGSVDQVVSLFGRRPISEIHRVLAVDGTCIVAIPGEEDLLELREEVQRAGHLRNRWEAMVEEMAADGLECVELKHWKHAVTLEPDAIADAMAMTYRGVRHSQQTRLDSLATMKVTLAADLVLLRRS